MKKFQPLMVAAGLLCIATPSFAGHWEAMEPASEGTITQYGDVQAWDGDTANGNPVDGHGEWYASKFTDERYPLELSGWASGQFRWVPDFVGEMPSGYASFRIYSGVYMEWSIPAANAVYVVDNGYNDNALESSTFTSAYGTWAVKQRGGYHLVRVDTSTAVLNDDGDLVLQLPHTQVKGSISVTPNNDLSLSQDVFLNYQAFKDPRSVSLTRDGASGAIPEKVYDATTNTVVDNPNLVKSRDEWVEADGTGHGHTLPSYLDRVRVPHPADEPPERVAYLDNLLPQGTDTIHPVTQTLNVNRSGGWAPVNQLRWFWSPVATVSTPPQEQQDEDSQTRLMPQSNTTSNPLGLGIYDKPADSFYTIDEVTGLPVFSVNGQHFNPLDHFTSSFAGWIFNPSDKAGQKVQFSYRLRDLTDDAVATAKYDLTLHDQWENALLDPKYVAPAVDLNTDGIPDEGYTSEWRYSVRKDDLPRTGGNTVGYDGDILVDRDDAQQNWTIAEHDIFNVFYDRHFQNSFLIGDWANTIGSTKTFE